MHTLAWLHNCNCHSTFAGSTNSKRLTSRHPLLKSSFSHSKFLTAHNSVRHWKCLFWLPMTAPLLDLPIDQRQHLFSSFCFSNRAQILFITFQWVLRRRPYHWRVRESRKSGLSSPPLNQMHHKHRKNNNFRRLRAAAALSESELIRWLYYLRSIEMYFTETKLIRLLSTSFNPLKKNALLARVQ